jgi:hypothetical protein
VESSLPKPGAITGPISNVCHSTNQLYSIAAVPGATSYTWMVPTGASITTNSGTSIKVSYGSGFTGAGYIVVKANNACGSGPADSLAVIAVPDAPAGISGQTSVCKSQTCNNYSVASVAGATSYTWTITGGANFSKATGSSVTLTAKASNACGTSATSTLVVLVSSKCSSKDDGAIDSSTVSGIPVEIGSELKVLVYPNPFAKQFHLKVESIDNAEVEVAIFSINGQLIAQQKDAIAGDDIIFGNNLAAGMYMVRVKQGDIVKTLRVIKSE